MTRKVEITVTSKVEKRQIVEVPEYFELDFYTCKLLNEEGDMIKFSKTRRSVFMCHVSELSDREVRSIESIAEEKFEEKKQERIKELEEL